MIFNHPEHNPAPRRGAIVATMTYFVVVALSLWLTRCDTSPQDEEAMSQGSILISFGTSDEGGGEAERAEPVVEQQSAPTPIEPVAEPTPTDPTSEVEQQIAPEEVTPTEEVVEVERQVNQRALFPGRESEESEQTRGEKESERESVVGSERGDHNNEAMLGGGLSGDFNLAGRSLIGSLPTPEYNQQSEGRVVINIIVDETGRVTSASLRANNSTTNNSALIEAARAAALKARFSVSESVVQNGTITYIFKLN